MIKKNPVNKLFTIAVICCLTVSPVFASDEIKYEKDIIKAAKQNKVENTTTEYLDNIDMLIFKQAYQNEDFKKALKTADYKIKVYETLYGKNSIQLRDAYFSKAELTLHAGLASEAEKAFIEAKKIAELTHKDNLLKEKINRIDEVKKNAFEYATESIKYINFRNDTFT